MYAGMLGNFICVDYENGFLRAAKCHVEALAGCRATLGMKDKPSL